jgi:thiol-disulfide isomerase/thioredoxin
MRAPLPLLSRYGFVAPALLLCSALAMPAAGCRPTPAPVASQSVPTRSQEKLARVLLINGGGTPRSNFLSHLLHIKQLNELLRGSGVAPARITIFTSDGADPEPDLAVRETQPETDFWLLQGTRLEGRLRTQIEYENSEVGDVDLQPATREALTAWFQAESKTLHPGDIVFLYVTDHGTVNKDDNNDNKITLWGESESISVTQLEELLATLDPGVRVVTLMSQCFSGAFANLMYTGAPDGVPRGNVCGFFSSTADRPAYGCYAENRDKDNVGHSFQFIDALNTSASFRAAHARVLFTDRTPDVPLTTSDVYLRNILTAAANARDQEFDVLVDELLRDAWRNKGQWEPEIRLLDSVGQAFGYFSPRSLAELREQSTLLPKLSGQFRSYSQAWRAAQKSLARENLDRFIASDPNWEARVNDAAVNALDPAGKRALTGALLDDLTTYTQGDKETAARLELLKQKADMTKEARYRMEVRLGVVLRMEAILTNIAGRVYLAQHATPAERDAFAALVQCEDLVATVPSGVPGLVEPEPFPSYEEELKLAEAALPGWMGIRFRQANPSHRERYQLEAGAVAVLTVYPDSAAQKAGLEVADIILGPPDDLFTESERIREWVMTAPIGKAQPLLVQRGDDRIQVTLTPIPYPLEWPSLPGPPKVGSVAPALEKVESYRGTVPAQLSQGGPYLLYFWATWCAPCKAALPELAAFERERQTPVIAITDETSEQLVPFFQNYDGPFPDAVAMDEFRRSFMSYGVSGTPSFVLIGADGKIQSTSTGYHPQRGLSIDGWKWSGTKATSAGG